MTFIKALYRYPVKSLGRETLDSVLTQDYGLQYDRKWMLVNADNQMLTQRELPQLTKLIASVSDEILTIKNKQTNDSLDIPIDEISSESIQTSIWDTEIVPSEVSQMANEWLSDQLSTQLSLVGAGKEFQRTKDVSGEKIPLLFADGYPILVLSQASVDHLNGKLDVAIDESRFRANIILDGCPAHSEDISDKMTVNQVSLNMIKPCRRCIMINTNQVDGQVSKEPLKTLSTYRTKDNTVLFGMNASVTKNGLISVNDGVTLDLKT